MNRREFAAASLASLGIAGLTSSSFAQVGSTLSQLAGSGVLPDFIDPALFGQSEFDVTLGRGTMSLASALSEVYFAINDRESAEQLRLVSTALIGDYNNNDLENVQSTINSKSDIDVGSLQIEANEEATGHMNRATLYSGLGIAYNAIAIDQGREFVDETSNSLRSGGGLGRIRGGLNVVRNRRIISLARAATQTLPGNLRLARNIYGASREYMRANDLQPPNQNDVDTALAGWD